jgi:hypothetical protein
VEPRGVQRRPGELSPGALLGSERALRRALKALGYVVLVYLLHRLLPTLKQALHSPEDVRWEWIAGAVWWVCMRRL